MIDCKRRRADGKQTQEVVVRGKTTDCFGRSWRGHGDFGVVPPRGHQPDAVLQLEKASNENLKDILGFCNIPLVSIDFNSNPLSSIVDAGCTDVINGNMVKIYSWYDNEAGYSNRMIDLAVMVGNSL